MTLWVNSNVATPCCFAGIVGEIDDAGEGYYIWTHKKFDIGYNFKQIVDVNLTSEAKVKLAPGIKISFTYEVRVHMWANHTFERCVCVFICGLTVQSCSGLE